MVALLGLSARLLGGAALGLVLQASLAAAGPRFVPSADGVRIAYETRGRGEPAVVLVHGWSCDRTYWKEQLAPLAGKFQVVTVDLAGHGASGRNRRAWTIASFGGDVAAVVEKLGLRRVVLVGHSMGGDVVAEAARLLPGRVDGLVWVDTYKQLGTFRTPEQVQTMVSSFRADFRKTTRVFARLMFARGADPALVERVVADMSSAPPAVALPSMEAAVSYDREMPGALRALGLPVVAINPDRPPSDAVALARHGVGLELMSGVGHFPMLEAPQRFNELLVRTIERIPRPEPTR
ncbi:MAG: alpha/beta hydrolase [Vicinamibacteria bacterium]